MSVKRQGFKRWLAAVLCTGVLCQALAVNVLAESNVAKALNEGSIQTEENIETENGYSITDLQKQFPNGRYWNHADNPGAANNNPMGTTATRCTGHVNGYNTSTCNHPTFSYHYGCWGYADQLGYLYAGSNPNNWAKKTSTEALNYLKTGDIIRFTTSGGGEHSVFVTGVSGNNITFSDCNWPEYINSSWIGTCKIRWNVTKDKSYFEKLKYIEICPTTDPTPPPDHVDDLGCTTAYAGWYRVKNSDGANVNQYHTKTFSTRGNMVAELPYNAYVYVSKATGQGSGQLGHITYQGVERYIAMNLFEKMSGSPIGSVDSYGGDAGSVWLNGWAFDWDNCEAQLQINVYLDNTLVYQGRADGECSDVNATYSNVVGSYHGFSLRVPTNLVGKFKFDVYAINVGTGDNTCLKSDWVTIQRVADTEAPVISNVQVSNITNQGYDISCTVTDNVGVNRVVFPTWTTLNDQDDIAQAWWDVNHTATRGTRNGDTWSFHVSIADHNNERGAYNTHIYAYDDAGNSVCYGVNDIVVPDPLPVVTFDANGGMAEFVTKIVNNGDVLGVLPEATQSGYIFEGWFTEPQGGTRMSHPDQYVVQGDMTLYAHWTPASGVGWHLDNGVLTIDCTGAMEDYFAVSDTPWFYARSQIRRVEVSGDVTSIGAYAFYGCDNLEEVSLPQSLQRINALAFGGCKKLASITIPRNVTDIGDYAFVGDTALRNVTFKGAAPEIGSGAFADVSADVYYPAEESGWTEDVRQGYLGSLAWLAA